MRRVRMLGLTLAATLLVPLAACGSDGGSSSATPGTTAAGGWPAVQAEATQEGKLVIYSAQTEATMAAVVAAFELANPDIEVDVVRMTAGDLESRVDQELAAGKLGADAVWSGEIPWVEGITAKGGAIVPSGPAAASWPASASHDGAITATLTPIVVAYNTDKVSPAPTSYDDLITPAHQGRIGLPQPTGSLVSASWALWQEQGLLERIAPLDAKIYPTTVPLTQAVGSGEIDWALGSYIPVIAPLEASGAPIDWVVLPPGTLPAGSRLMAMEKASHPATAQVFVDWIMTPAGQEAVVGESGSFASALPDIPHALDIDQSLLIEPDWSKWTDRASLDEVQALLRKYFG